MGYQKANGQWADTVPVDLADVADEAAGTDDGATLELGDRGTLRLLLTVSALSDLGDPTLDVTVETSHDGTTWSDVGTFTQATATGSERKRFAGIDRFVRVSWVVVDSVASFTVTGEAV